MRNLTPCMRRAPGPASTAVGVVAVIVALAAAAPARATSWTVPLTIANGGGTQQSLELGIHPQGTAGVDPELGEVGLPPWPPSAVFDARFVVAGCEGLRLDLRDDSMTERTHLIQWQAGDGGYPVTIRWNRSGLPPGTFTMSDGYTGSLIPAFDMTAVDSLRIPAAQSYIKRVRITVLPGSVPPQPPAITPPLPSLTVFVGQRFPDVRLDDHVTDPDNPVEQLLWTVAGDGPPWLSIGADRVLRIESPEGWTGTKAFTLRVVDPGGLEDQQEISLAARAPGPPQWSRALTIVNGGGQSLSCDLGLDSLGTDGLDPGLGEVALPPWPPSGVFESRLILPDGVTASRRDIRAGDGEEREFHLVWQAGAGGHPLTVSWPADLPPGDYHVRDDLGGVFLPPLDMTASQSLTVPDSLSFITGLIITVRAVVDTTPPLGPAGLDLAGQVPGVSVLLDWSGWPCSEEHFAYYEILFDTLAFADQAAFSWDWSEDPALAQIATTQTTVLLPAAGPGYAFRIRAWDAFGNAGPLSSPCYYGALSGVPPGGHPKGMLDNAPNPFGSSTLIRYILPREMRIDLDVFDVRGRRIRRLHSGPAPAGSSAALWDGRLEDGSRAPGGVYFCRLVGPGIRLDCRLVLVK